MASLDAANIYDKVREHYSSAARGTSTKYGETVAKSFGYSADELASIPQESNLGLSCGNPLAIASLKEVSEPAIHQERKAWKGTATRPSHSNRGVVGRNRH